MKTKDNFYRTKVRILLFLLWLMGVATAFSQDYLFDVEIINVEDGLPHRMTYDIVQDEAGFIWVSTQGAISRYDGYRFKTYNASFLGIAENKYSYLAIDANNRLWYGEKSLSTVTKSGIIDTSKDRIYSMESISNGLFNSEDVAYISNASASSDEILIATWKGKVYAYNGTFREIYHHSEAFNMYPFCKSNPDGSYWIFYDKKALRVKNGNVLNTINVGAFSEDVIATSPKLVLKTNDPVSRYRVLEKDSMLPFAIAPHKSETIKAILRLHKEYTCYIVENVLLVRDKKGRIIYRFDDFKTSGYETRLNTSTLLLDRQNILWAATQDGILKFTAKKNPFETLLSDKSVRGIFKGDSVLRAGIVNERNTSASDTIKIAIEQPLIIHNSATTFHKDHKGHLWIGTRTAKIIEYIPKQDTLIDHRFGIPRKSFQIPFQNRHTKNYFVGTNKGLLRLDIENKKTTPFPLPLFSEAVNIRHIWQNVQGIWLVSDKGIFLMDAEEEVILKHYTIADGLPTNSILHIHEDKDGIFWLGTSDAGLVRWDFKANNFRQYTRDDELSNNKIYAVYEDDFETLWLSSDYGLMAFDKITETTRVYLPKDGIAHEEFNRFSHFQDTDGTLYFGGLNGITKFHPAALKENSATVPPMHLTRLKLLEKDSETFTDRTSEYNTTKKITLKPNDRILELELTLLDYESSVENQYAYRLIGKQDRWIYTRDNTISIINPPYGSYDLEVKARGASGSWLENPLVIPMHVKAPFYRQWWFVVTLVLITIMIVVLTVKWRVKKLRSDRSRLEIEVQKRTRQIEEDKQTIEQQAEELKALDKTKSRFFANITHEFRTPLTLVRGPIEQMIANPPPPAMLRKRLRRMLNNTDNLIELINQLLDLSKLEGKRMKVAVSHGDIIRYTEELTRRFQALVNKKQLELRFTADNVEWKTHFDSDKWTKIVYNLLSNAVKFTPEGGSIEVHLRQLQWEGQDCIQLKVKDDGIGIAPEKLAHIFDRFYQVDASSTRLQGGTGIGLSLVKELIALQNGSIEVNSIIHKGTEFTVILPVAVAPDGEAVLPTSLPETMLIPPITDEVPSEDIASLNGKPQNKEALELLIIEDNAEMRNYIRSCINTSIYNISEASNGEEGIEKAQEMVPDLIISDVMMPKKNGFEVTQAIREHTATSHIPLILLTAKAALESRLEGLSRGADAYLTKPFSSQELTLRIQKLIELRRLLLQRYQNQDSPLEKEVVFEKEDRFIGSFKAYILDNLSEPDLGAETISQHFAMSRVQLYRKLKALINTPVAHYIRTIRLEEALRLLKQGELNVTEIAYETGFSPSNFSKIFKKTYGKLPSEF